MDFIPYKEADKLNWYSNLLGKIDTEGPLLGLTAAEVTQLKSICNTNNTVIKDCMDAQTNAQKARAAKEVQLKNGDKDLRILIRKMKTRVAIRMQKEPICKLLPKMLIQITLLINP